MRRLLLILITFISFGCTTHSFAADDSTPLVKIRLLAEKAEVKGGEEIWIGTEQSIAPHWHTYWKNPGDSGTPPAIKWTLPDGFEVSDIHWPTPDKIPYEPLLNYGYEENVVLLQKLRLPENLPTGEITLSADIELLVCKVECIPEYGTYTLTLNGPNAAAEDNKAYFKQAFDKLPKHADFEAVYSENNDNFMLEIKSKSIDFTQTNLNAVEIIPQEWGIIKNAAPSEARVQDGTLIIEQPRDERELSAISTLNGVLKLTGLDATQNNFKITATPKAESAQSNTSAQESAASFSITKILQAIAFALIGGLILNLMPCVFPVLSIKALSLVKIAEKHPEHARMHGLAYTAGVMLSFLVIAGALIVLQAGGSQIGWGFQLQNPLIVGLLSYLLFIIGLNLIGFFEFVNPFAKYWRRPRTKRWTNRIILYRHLGNISRHAVYRTLYGRGNRLCTCATCLCIFNHFCRAWPRFGSTISGFILHTIRTTRLA